MIYVQFGFVVLIISDISILTDARSIYTVVGSTLNLKFKDNSLSILHNSKRHGHYYDDRLTSDAIKYDIVIRPSIIELQIKNVTTINTGLYEIDNWKSVSSLQLSITSMCYTCCVG